MSSSTGMANLALSASVSDRPASPSLRIAPAPVAAQGESAVSEVLTAKPARKSRSRHKENREWFGFLRRSIRAAGTRVVAQGPDDLAELVALRGQLDQVITDTARKLNSAENGSGQAWSWSEIGAACGITKQSAQQRWGQK